MANPTYDTLHEVLANAANASRATDSAGFARDLLDAIWPEIEEKLCEPLIDYVRRTHRLEEFQREVKRIVEGPDLEGIPRNSHEDAWIRMQWMKAVVENG